MKNTSDKQIHPEQIRDENPFFIVGAPRSGTTLLQYMLRSHPQLSIPSCESHFFVPLLRHRAHLRFASVEDVQAQLTELKALKQRFFESDLHGINPDTRTLSEQIFELGCGGIADFIRNLYVLNACGEGKRVWGDKTPYYVRHIPLLRSHFPGAKFIHLVRDGRDVALSMLERSQDFSVFNTYTAARHWEYYLQPVVDAPAGEQLLNVRYEDLLNAPEVTVRQILDFLQQPYDRSVIEYKKTRDKKGITSKTPLLSKPIHAKNMEKWRSRMTDRQIRVFESIAGTYLHHFGYPLENDTARIGLAESLLYRAHNQANKILRKKNLQPKPRRSLSRLTQDVKTTEGTNT